MIFGLKVGVLPSFVQIPPAIVEVRECSIRVCSFREPPPSIFLWKIDYLPVLCLRVGVLHMFDAYTHL